MTNEQVLAKADEDFALRNLSERTRESYLYDIGQFLAYSGKENYSDLDQDDLRSYLLHLRCGGGSVALSTSNQYNSACKFLLQTVLGQTLDSRQVPNAKARHKQQRPFLVSELVFFFSLITDIRDFAFFLTLYGCGLRTSELRRLRCPDISTDRVTGRHYLEVRCGKGGKGRRVDLPPACYDALRRYWRAYRPENPGNWMFPAKDPKDAVGPCFFTTRFNDIREHDTCFADLHQHSLRHTFSTNMMQHCPNGILRLKMLLGHASLASTEIYIGLAELYGEDNRKSPSEICGMLYDAYLERNGRPSR
jgi:integrase/recombinase XerD